MDAQALATTPIFLCSLVICALVAAYGIAMIFLSLFRRVSRIAASAGLRPGELESVEHAGIFHNQLEDFIDRIITLEEMSAEIPEPFNDQSWSRLVELSDNLEMVRGELHAFLQQRDFEAAHALGRLLCGTTSIIPEIPRTPGAVELRLVSHWHHQVNELLERMVTKIEDSLQYRAAEAKPSPSSQFLQSLDELKSAVSQFRSENA